MSGWSDSDDAWTAKVNAKKNKKVVVEEDPWSDDEPVKTVKKPIKPKVESDWSEDDDKFVPETKAKRADPVPKKSSPPAKVKPQGDDGWSDEEDTKTKKKKPIKPVEEKPKKKPSPPAKKAESDWSEDEPVKPKKSAKKPEPEVKKPKKPVVEDRWSDEEVKPKPSKKPSKPKPDSDWSEDEKPKKKPSKQPEVKKPKKPVVEDTWSDEEVKPKPSKKPSKPKPDSDWSEEEKPKKKPSKQPEVKKPKKPVVEDTWSDEEVKPKPSKKPSTPKPDSDWSEDEAPKKQKPSKSAAPPKPKKKPDSDWSEDEKPKKKAASKPKPTSDWSEDEAPKKQKPTKSAPPQKPVSKKKPDSDWSEDEKPKKKQPPPKPAAKKPAADDGWSSDEPKKPVKKAAAKAKPASDDWSEDEAPKKPAKKAPVKKKVESDWSEEEVKPVKSSKKPPQKKVEDDWSEDEAPKKPVKKAPVKKKDDWSDEESVKPAKKTAQKKSAPADDDWSDDEKPVKKAPVKKSAPPAKKPAPKPAANDSDNWSDSGNESPKKSEKKKETKERDAWSESEMSVAQSKPKKAEPKKFAKKEPVVEEKDESDAWGSDADEKPKGKKKFKKKGSDDDSDDDSLGGGSDAGSTERTPVTYVPDYDAAEDDDLYNYTCRAGLNFANYKEIPVQCSGYDKKNTDVNIARWRDIEDLNDDLKDKIVNKMKWKTPTPIQQRAVPLLIEGRDIMGCAQTGSGKTGAFSLPIVNELLSSGVGQGSDDGDDEDRTCCTPMALVCAPTRELVQQIQRDFVKLTKDTDIKCEYVVGGHAVRNQLEKIEGSHIIVATPGRLNDFVGKGKIKLDKLKYLVIDEADRMLEMGFQTIIEALALKMPDKDERTTAMFSATFPDEVQKIGHKFLRENYVFVAIGIVGCAANTVKQEIIEIGGDVNKEDKLMDLLEGVKENGEKTVIFVETKRMADYLATKLCSQDYPATSIHGDREQREREEALRTFRSGEHPILVATNVAARGIDIPEVMHVINHDLPKDIDEYVHRIGRTGRCGNIGRATSFYKSQYDKEKATRLCKILEQSSHDVPKFLQDECDDGGFGDGVAADAPAEDSDDGW